MMSGLGMTVLIALGTIILSLIFGTVLALLRHFCHWKMGMAVRAHRRLHRVFPLHAQYSVDFVDSLYHQG